MGSCLFEGVSGGRVWLPQELQWGGRGHGVCRGDNVCRVLLDGVGDRLLGRGVRFQVDEKEADVCFKLLPEDCDGGAVPFRGE